MPFELAKKSTEPLMASLRRRILASGLWYSLRRNSVAATEEMTSPGPGRSSDVGLYSAKSSGQQVVTSEELAKDANAHQVASQTKEPAHCEDLLLLQPPENDSLCKDPLNLGIFVPISDYAM